MQPSETECFENFRAQISFIYIFLDTFWNYLTYLWLIIKFMLPPIEACWYSLLWAIDFKIFIIYKQNRKFFLHKISWWQLYHSYFQDNSATSFLIMNFLKTWVAQNTCSPAYIVKNRIFLGGGGGDTTALV